MQHYELEHVAYITAAPYLQLTLSYLVLEYTHIIIFRFPFACHKYRIHSGLL
jgi:hypothetical protein